MGTRIARFVSACVLLIGSAVVVPTATADICNGCGGGGDRPRGGGGGGALGGASEPQITIDDVTQSEDAASGVNFRFIVRLSAPSTKTVRVDFRTLDGTADSASDYVAKSGTVRFAPGAKQRPIDIESRFDPFPEPDETFFVRLSNPVNATFADRRGRGTIIDNDITTP